MKKDGKPHRKPPRQSTMYVKMENLIGNPPPQSTMYVKKELIISRQLCPSLQDDCAKNGTSGQ
jgi:hypothetical protein